MSEKRTFAGKLPFALCMVLMLLAACGGRWDAEFCRMDAIMDNHPDSVLAMLDSVEADGVDSEADRARCALLRSQALDKCYIDVTDDSLISIAVQYYSSRSDCREKMLAYYYLSRVHYNSGNLLASLRAALEAKQIAEKLEDYYYLGMTEESLADIYKRSHNAKEELAGAEAAIAAFRKTDKANHLRWAYIYKAKALYNMHRTDESKSLLDSIADIAYRDNDTTLQTACEEGYMDICEQTDNETLAHQMPERFLKIVQPSVSSYTNMIAYYSFFCPQPDSLAKYIKEVRKSNLQSYEQLYVDYHQSELFYMQGKPDSAYLTMRNVAVQMDTLYHSLRNAQIMSCQSDFYKSVNQEEMRIKERNRMINVFVIITLAIVTTSVAIVMHERMRRKNAEMERNMELLDQLRRQLTSSRHQEEHIKKAVAELFQQQNSTLDELCNTYYMLTSKDDEKTKIYQRVQKIIKSFRSKEKQEALASAINRTSNNLYDRLTESLPKLSPKEKSYLLYTMAGLSNKAIVFLLQTSDANAYKIKSRLMKRISTADEAIKDEILRIMH